MEISFRTATGWSEREKHAARSLTKNANDHYKCPKCGAGLMVAPHGGIYCNAVHGTNSPKGPDARARGFGLPNQPS